MTRHRSRQTTVLPVFVGGLVALVAISVLVEKSGWFDGLAFAVQRSADQMPSTRVVLERDIRSGVPILSLVVRQDDLDHPDTGLLTHPLEKGSAWERPAYVSYFDRGALRFASQAGIRIHGGKSRENSPVQSFRLYFAKRYGATAFPPGLLFSRAADPVRHLVVHNDLRRTLDYVWWHFVNPLAYDISRAIGALVPETYPAIVMLNGETLGAYVLTEHVTSDTFLDARFGHRQFDIGDTKVTEDLRRWRAELPAMTIASVGREVDVENLTSWFLSMLFCATTDPFQGVLLRNRNLEDARWFWINWDMDHSFMDLYKTAAHPWEHDTFDTLLGSRELRSSLVTGLLSDDPNYVLYFKRRFNEMLNHRLTRAFLLERFDHYGRLAERLRVPDTAYRPVLAEFLAKRPAALRALAPEYLPDAESIRVDVTTPAEAPIEIDGLTLTSRYQGWYLRGTPMRLSVPETERVRFLHWVVNGRAVDSSPPALTLEVREPLQVQAVFR
jgi:hypothetical protein